VITKELTKTAPAAAQIGADRQATAAGVTFNRYVRSAVTITTGKNATLAVAFSRH
jgi:maltoporin